MKQKSKTLRLLSYLRNSKLLCILDIFFCIFNVAGVLCIPILTGRIVHHLSIGGFYSQMFTIHIIALCITVGILGISSYLFTAVSGYIGLRATRLIRTDIVNHVTNAKTSVIDSHSHGDLIARIGTDVGQISDGLIQGITQSYSSIMTIAGTIGLMLWIDWRCALVVICLTPISIVVSIAMAKFGHKIFAKQSKVRGKIGGLVSESFQNQKAIRLFHYEDDIEKQFDTLNEELRHVGTKAQFSTAIINPTTRFCNGLVYTAVAIYGALSIIFGISRLDIGGLTTFLMFATQYTKPFNDISSVATELTSAYASAERVFTFLDSDTEQETGKLHLAHVTGEIEFDNVSFGYSKDLPLIKNLNLKIDAGTRVAIVGPTGCGKTTLINLLMRFYDVNSGSIRLDGNDIRDITLSSLRKSFGMVLQESWLARGTIADAISYGSKSATRDEIIMAAKRAHAHRFIELFPNGYDTTISNDDNNFSTGQKQLLMIARILLMNPPMLILDEATSNIDTRTELHIQHAFARMTSGKTSFIIAHRLSTIKDADIILVMRDGDIIETGKHSELLKKNGFYAELFNSQFE